jgi:hypothetical protein
MCSSIPLNEAFITGPAVAQSVFHRVPKAAARVRARESCMGFVVDKAELGQVFS